MSNVRAEDVAAAVVHLSQLKEAIGQAYNISDDSHPTVEEALCLAAKVFETTPPRVHMPLPIIKLAARIDGYFSARKGKIPDLEYDAVKYLYDDYVVDNTKLKSTGFRFQYPDFKQSMEQIGEWYKRQKSR